MKSFLTWLETEGSPALSEPQHKKNEKGMALDDVVGKKIESMIEEMEREKKSTKKEILDSLGRYLKQTGSEEKPEPEPQSQQQPVPQGQGQQQALPQQTMEINPVAQGANPGNF